MAKILVAFFNCMNDPENPNAMPIFYEAFIRGLDRAGNQVAVFSHGMFGMDFWEIDPMTKASIQQLDPDICFIFNNSFFDISDVVDCPIVIYEVDSPRYFANKSSIRKNPDRYLYYIFQEDSRKTLQEEYGISPSKIFWVPFFSEVYADPMLEQTTNISFIGSLFAAGDTETFGSFIKSSPSTEEVGMMRQCLQELEKNPQVTATELVYKYNITSELVARHLNLPQLLIMLSGEKRLRVLSSVAELGLDLYGTENWQNTYYFHSNLNMSYINKKVYSIEQNQDIYNTSKIGINVSHLQATSGFPWRVMDIMASNACLVTDYHADFERLFGNIPIPTYDSTGEAYTVCRQLLNDEKRRSEIVAQCQEVIDRKYRFKHLLPKLEENSGVKLHV